MPDASLFIDAALRHGFTAEAAAATLAAVEARVAERGLASRRYFCYRSGAPAPSADGGAPPPPARPRLLLVFPSADDALSFAQLSGIGRSPRLMALTLAQALAAVVERPAIGALLVAAADEASAAGPRALPPGLRVERGELLALLGAPPEMPRR